MLGYYIGNDSTYLNLTSLVGDVAGVNALTRDYGYALAGLVENFEVDVDAAYQAFIVDMASEAANRISDFASAAVTWVGSWFGAHGVYTNEEGQLTKDLLVNNANDHADTTNNDFQSRKTGLDSWAAGLNTPWSTKNVGILDAASDLASTVGSALVTVATNLGGAAKQYGNSHHTAAEDLATDQVTAVTQQDTADAGQQVTYVTNVSAADTVFTVDSASVTKVRDKAIIDAEKTHADQIAKDAYKYEISYSDAKYTYRQVTADAHHIRQDLKITADHVLWQATNDHAVNGDNALLAAAEAAHADAYFNADNAYKAAETAADDAKYVAFGEAAKTWVKDKASAYETLVNSTGVAMRTWATDMTNHAKTFAASAKGHGDTLATGFMQNANTAVSALALAAKGYANQSLAADVQFDNSTATAQGGLVNSLSQAQADHESDITQHHNTYVAARHGQHAGGLQTRVTANTNAGIDTPAADLTNYHSTTATVAQTAASAAGTAVNAWTTAIGAAAVGLTQGLTGASTSLVSSLGLAATTFGGTVADLAEAMSETIGHGFSLLARDASHAGNQRDEQDVGAEADFWKDEIHARADFNDFVADRLEFHSEAIGEAVKVRIIARETEAAWQAYFTTIESIQDQFRTVDLKDANVAHATDIGDALILRAGKLGDNLIQETQSIGGAAEAFNTTENTGVKTYIDAEAAAAELHGNEHAAANKAMIDNAFGAIATFVGGQGTANVDFESALGSSQVTAARGQAGAEATYHVQMSGRTATHYTTQSAGSSSPLPGLEAARETAFGNWIALMSVPYQDYAEAYVQREADLAVDLAEADKDRAVSVANANTSLYSALAADEKVLVAALGAIDTSRAALLSSFTNIYTAAMATEQSVLDNAYALAIKTFFTDAAAADKQYLINVANEVENAEHTHAVKIADADVTRVTSEANADLAWSTNEAGEFRDMRDGIINGVHTLVAPTLSAYKVRALDEASREADWLTAVVHADNGYSTDFVAAYNLLDIDEVTEDSGYRTLSLQHQSTEFTTLAASQNLPFVDFRSEQTSRDATHAATQQPIDIAGAGAIASIRSVAQTAINALHSTWVADVNLANANWVSLVTTALETEAIAKQLAEKTYALGLSGPAETFQIDLAEAARDARIARAIAHRDAVANNAPIDTSAADHAARVARQQAEDDFNASETSTNATRVSSRSTADTSRSETEKNADIALTTALANADKTLLQGEATLAAQRDIDVINELHDQAIAELNAYGTVVDDLATSMAANPWAQNAQDEWNAEKTYLVAELGERRDYAIGEVNAKKELANAIETATATRTAEDATSIGEQRFLGTRADNDAKQVVHGPTLPPGYSPPGPDDSQPSANAQKVIDLFRDPLRKPPKPSTRRSELRQFVRPGGSVVEQRHDISKRVIVQEHMGNHRDNMSQTVVSEITSENSSLKTTPIDLATAQLLPFLIPAGIDGPDVAGSVMRASMRHGLSEVTSRSGNRMPLGPFDIHFGTESPTIVFTDVTNERKHVLVPSLKRWGYVQVGSSAPSTVDSRALSEMAVHDPMAIARANLIGGGGTFVLHLIPFVAAIDYASEGKQTDAGKALLADMAAIATLNGTKYVRVVGMTAQGSLIVVSTHAAAKDVGDGKYMQASGRLGEIILQSLILKNGLGRVRRDFQRANVEHIIRFQPPQKLYDRPSLRLHSDVTKIAGKPVAPRVEGRLVNAERFSVPFTSSLQSKGVAAVKEAAVASGLTGRNLVDKVVVRSGRSAFTVQKNGRRILYLDQSVVAQPNRGMLLREAAHELVHAEQYAKALAAAGGDVTAARRAFLVSPRSYRYAVDEVVAETLARRRIGKYLGNFSQETLRWSDDYLREWQSIWRARRFLKGRE